MKLVISIVKINVIALAMHHNASIKVTQTYHCTLLVGQENSNGITGFRSIWYFAIIRCSALITKLLDNGWWNAVWAIKDRILESKTITDSLPSSLNVLHGCSLKKQQNWRSEGKLQHLSLKATESSWHSRPHHLFSEVSGDCTASSLVTTYTYTVQFTHICEVSPSFDSTGLSAQIYMYICAIAFSLHL